MDARLIIDEPARGSWNMAVDEALLQSAQTTGALALRFYQWSEPTLSLGYFQSVADRERHRPSSELPAVRRSTGGGAIVHDHELTYSLTCPIHDRFSSGAQDSVTRMHEAIIAVLHTSFGVTAELCGDQESKAQESFLCFERRSDLDVMIHEHKIAGSAQRRHHGAMLQHGSIILGRSTYATMLPGIADITGRELCSVRLTTALTDHIRASLPIRLNVAEATPNELEAAKGLEEKRYANSGWTNRR